MESITHRIYEFIGRTELNESLAALLRDKMKDQKREIPQDYYYLTHLTNPAQTFWSFTRPEIEKSIDLRIKLALGRRLQAMAGVWFRNLPEFVVEEGKLDGEYLDVKRVRGNIDYRLGDSIIEFKTKENIPNNEEDIFNLYPQDLEQLVFYSGIHPSKLNVNYLVFMTDSRPFKLKAFKVITKDFNKVRTLMRNRIKDLDKCISEKNPTILGQCRYFNGGCEFRESNTCSCDKQKPLSMILIKTAIEINYDEEFTKRLHKLKEDNEGFKSAFTKRDIISPRRHYMETVIKLTDDWISDNKIEGYKAHLSHLVNQLNINLNEHEREKTKELLKDARLCIASHWVKIKDARHTVEPKIVPYLIKVNKSKDKQYIRKLDTYALTELGIMCVAYGKSSGLVFAIYPNLDDFIQVFEVTYKNTQDLLKLCKEILDLIEKAESEKNILLLPSCPDFMNKEKKCPMTSQCHIDKNSGCLPGFVIVQKIP